MNHPKGILIAIGGAEDKGAQDEKERHINFYEEGILRQIADAANKREEARIEIITTASSIPNEVAMTYKKAFKKLGCVNVGHLKLREREEADQKKVLERLEQCNCVLFSGGDQIRLCSVLGGTEFSQIIKERYESEYFVIAGTSAGAAAMSNTMICGGGRTKSFDKGDVELSIGFGLLPSVIIDTHFDARGRFGRLLQAIAAQPGSIGIGLDEDTGVIVEKGTRLKAIGSSSVVLIDGKHVRHNNVAQISEGMPLSLANLHVHLMVNTDVFDLSTREFIPGKFHGEKKTDKGLTGGA
ncbi:MAG TPA: cyanophycinase [Chitinophagaceae bacterium]|jgi:cyanophycinase|nr:cyanophycinase [Chitinophagaceae bacterium]